MAAARFRAPIQEAPQVSDRPKRKERRPVSTPVALRASKTAAQSGRKTKPSLANLPMIQLGPQGGFAPAGSIFCGGKVKGRPGRTTMKSNAAGESPTGFRSRGPSAERQARMAERTRTRYRLDPAAEANGRATDWYEDHDWKPRNQRPVNNVAANTARNREKRKAIQAEGEAVMLSLAAALGFVTEPLKSELRHQ